ncbi:MAG: hypothetical protein V3V99_10680 [candidate division Zixibacteria bacterium]
MGDNYLENNDNNERLNKLNADSCDCRSADCCSTDGREQSSIGRKVKNIIFAIVMLTAVALAIYSLGYQEDDTANAGVNQGELNKTSFFTDDLLTDSDFLYIVLEGAGSAVEKNPEILSLVEDVAESIRKSGVDIITVKTAPGEELFSSAVDNLSIQDLPAVVVAKKGKAPAILTGELSETTLMKAYLSGGCDPATCDPNNCGN